ncbi:hypothetical protein BC831DRAFT_399665 [Entophlyctis helioformis]|nr:hypothetical protein BC831DRAFT_399665 [Entophlyctis helioformis]
MVTIEQAVADAASDPLAASLAFLLPSVAAPAAGIPRQPESVSAVSPSATSVVDILGSLFGDQLRVFGKDSAFTSPDVAFGNLVADSKNRQDLADAVTHALGVSGLPAALKDSLAQWTESRLKANARSNSEAAARLSTLLESQSSIESMVPAARNAVRALANKRDLLAPASRWLVDVDTLVSIDSSAIHQIVASGENMNVLAITSTPFDPTAAAGPRVERDVGLYAMNYGGAYVASICPSYSYAQAVQALREADAFRGPSIVIAYVPNPQLLRGFAKSALGVVNNVQSAINAGLWTLYRWHPFGGKAATAGEPAFTLDSSKIKNDIEQFLDRNAQLSLLVEPELTPAYLEPSLDKQIQKRVESQVQRSYDALFATLDRKSLLVLFGSDGGNGEALAKRIAHEAKEKGLYVQVMAADAFVAEDLERQERVLFVVSTAGQGEFPGNIRETWKFLSAASAPRLESLNYAVFALGDRHYWPRPEDAHFFAKAGKDLDARLAVLGASRLTHLGIGDDRDPDGLYTGFNAWVPGFWTALGVAADPVAAEANVPSDDAIKLASNYLRGTIAEGLVDTSTGALAEYDTKLTKFHGIYQQDDRDLREGLARRGLEKAFSFMVRIRVPGGVATTAQWLAMNDIADRLANGTIKITTRQAFQFHGIVKSNLKQSIQEINRALMDTIAACGDVNRNVMCNPNPVDSAVHKEVLDFSRRLSAHMTPQTSAYHEIWLDKKLVATFGNEEPMYGKTYLPRKFKVAVAVPPYNDVDVFAHDLGYIAIVRDGRLLGFNVTVGGGMGQTHGNKKTYPMLAQPLGFCTVEQAVDVGEKVLLVQRDYGDRTNRRHARLKYTIEDRGLEWFRGQVEERLGYKLEAPQPYTFTTNGDRYGWTRGTDGLWAYTLFVANGRVKDTPEYRLKSGLAELAAVHRGTLALTPNQHLVVAGITDDQRPVIQRVLDRYSLSNAGLSGLRLGSMACVALPTCALAMAESERYLPSLVDKIEDTLDGLGMRSEAVTIRMTGCPNGCARPQLAEIGFIGKAPGMYNMYLGGGFAGERLSMLYKESVDEDAIMTELGLLLGRWSRERLGDEHFGDYCVRVGVVKPEVRKVTV